MEQVLFLKKETRLAILSLMLSFYNNPKIRFFNKKLAFSFIKKCAKKFELSASIGNAYYFEVDDAYDILKKEKEEVKYFFREILKYQAYVTADYKKTIFEPHECAEDILDIVFGWRSHVPITSDIWFVKQDPFAKENRGRQYIIYNIEDLDYDNVVSLNLNNICLNQKSKITKEEIFYKDL